jgi:hypothetical protein
MLEAMEASSTASESQAMPAEPRDWMPWLLGLGTFSAVMLATLAFALAGFRVSSDVLRAAPWVLLAAFLVALKVTVPNSRLSPDRLRRRERRTDGALIGILAAIATVSSIAAAFYLRSLTDWLALAGCFVTAFGVGLMIRTRMSIGPG